MVSVHGCLSFTKSEWRGIFFLNYFFSFNFVLFYFYFFLSGRAMCNTEEGMAWDGMARVWQHQHHNQKSWIRFPLCVFFDYNKVKHSLSLTHRPTHTLTHSVSLDDKNKWIESWVGNCPCHIYPPVSVIFFIYLFHLFFFFLVAYLVITISLLRLLLLFLWSTSLLALSLTVTPN